MFDDLPFGAPASIALAPVDLTGGAKTTLWASIRDCNDFLSLLFYFGAGTATQDITITLQQATSAAGGGAKALTVREAWFKRGTGGSGFTAANAAAQDRFTKSPGFNRESAAANYATATDRVATTNHFFGLLRISPKDLDQSNSFRYVQASFSSPAASQLGFALWLPMGMASSGIGAPSLLT